MARPKTKRVFNTEWFTLVQFADDSFGLIPPPKFIVALSGAITLGEINKRGADEIVEEWQRQLIPILLKTGILEIRNADPS